MQLTEQYRPRTWDDVVGQDEVLATINAGLFAGPGDGTLVAAASTFAISNGTENLTGLPGFFEHNLIAALKELAIVGPVSAVVWWLRKPS